MSYIGQNLPSNSFIGYTTDTFAGDGSATTFTMSKAPFNESSVIVVINNVVQQPTADFTISGTTLTIDAAVADGDVIYATHIGGALPIGQANKLVSNNLTVNDTEIDLSSGDLTVDVAGEIILDADGGILKFQDGGTEIFQINNGSSNANLKSTVQDKDIRLQGNDGGATITALTLDMSDAGAATLNNGLTLTSGNASLASGVIDSSTADLKIYSSAANHCGIRFASSAAVPITNDGGTSDGAMSFGSGSYRWATIFASTGAINTSDKNEKQDIEELTDAEKKVAVVAKGLLRKYKFKDAVEKKGDKARTHFGVIAQDLEDAFKAEGLDASKYGMFCSDTWWETQTEVAAVEAVEEVTDEEGNVTTEAVEAKNAYTRTDAFETLEEAPEGATERTRLGVRYSELLAFIIIAI